MITLISLGFTYLTAWLVVYSDWSAEFIEGLPMGRLEILAVMFLSATITAWLHRNN